MSNQKRKSNCPINHALELFGDRWTLLIIRDLAFKGKSHYNEFLQSEEKIATNILADRLQQLEINGIVIKQTDPAHGSKLLYKLTDKGIALVPLLIEIILWSARYDMNTPADPSFIDQAYRDRDYLINAISFALKEKLAARV
jgi:DNA-binding HxlR family transcriptional regulator